MSDNLLWTFPRSITIDNVFGVEHDTFYLNVFILTFVSCVCVFHLAKAVWGFLPKREKRFFGYQQYMLRHLAIATFTAGYIVYFIGFFFHGTASSPIAYIIRPFLASLQMFLIRASYNEINAEYTNSPLFMAIFALVNGAAITISAVFIINSLHKRVHSSYLNCLWNVKGRYLNNKKKNLNIFWGFNDPSIILGKDIANKKEHLVYIDTQSVNQKGDDKLSLSQLLGIFPYKRNYIQQLEGTDYIIKHATYDLTNMQGKGQNMLDQKNLFFLRKLIKRHKTTRFFFLSDEREANILSVINIIQDKIFDEVPGIEIYCHANRTLENQTLLGIKDGVKVNLVDSSYLSVAALKLMSKQDVAYTEYVAHPINFVDTDGKGHVTSDFNAMVLGFGHTGQEALKFVYEFSSFLKAPNKQSFSKCYCVDDRMDRHKEDFLLSVPEARNSDRIEFYYMTYHSEAFWQKMSELIHCLNYVVIATGNDNTNVSMATQIFDYANRYRKNGFEHFKIFVRLYKEEQTDKILEVIGTLNGIAKYDSASVELEGKPETGRTDEDVVMLFGRMNEIFNYDVVINDKIRHQAQKFKKNYDQLSSWVVSNSQIVKKQKNLFLAEQSYRRKEMQNFNNALHIYTKAQLVGGYEAMLKLPHQQYELEDKLLLEALSETEHLRWNASHQMLGYMPMDADMEKRMQIQDSSCNEQLKRHSCLIPYNELSEKYKGFDRDVIKTTLKILHDDCDK